MFLTLSDTLESLGDLKPQNFNEFVYQKRFRSQLVSSLFHIFRLVAASSDKMDFVLKDPAVVDLLSNRMVFFAEIIRSEHFNSLREEHLSKPENGGTMAVSDIQESYECLLGVYESLQSTSGLITSQDLQEFRQRAWI